MRAEYRAFIVHRTPTRLRIKIPDWRWHDAHFAALERALLNQPDVVDVSVNALAASIVIYCREGFDIETTARQFVGMKVLSRSGAIDPDVASIPFVFVKIAVAILTKQLPAQLIEWGLDALLHGAAQSAYWKAAGSPRLTRGARPLLLPLS